MPLDVNYIADQVKKIKILDPDAFVILFPHWGNNYQWYDEAQISLSDSLFLCGVDLIIGHGSHMMQEFEKRNKKLVLYTLEILCSIRLAVIRKCKLLHIVLLLRLVYR